ncbi:MAG: hypothetical protein Q7T87_00360 [Polaromonas sp.]|nr:hypothetical protein [Polaromonas sp.]
MFAVLVLCVTPLSSMAAPLQPASADAPASSLVWTAATTAGADQGLDNLHSTPAVSAADTSAADLTSELPEPLAAAPAGAWPVFTAALTGWPVRHALPYPLLERPKRPPRA